MVGTEDAFFRFLQRSGIPYTFSAEIRRTLARASTDRLRFLSSVVYLRWDVFQTSPLIPSPAQFPIGVCVGWKMDDAL
jgi:hypothetical protein